LCSLQVGRVLSHRQCADYFGIHCCSHLAAGARCPRCALGPRCGDELAEPAHEMPPVGARVQRARLGGAPNSARERDLSGHAEAKRVHLPRCSLSRRHVREQSVWYCSPKRRKGASSRRHCDGECAGTASTEDYQRNIIGSNFIYVCCVYGDSLYQ
jgi:hypothetical protein